MQNRRKQQAPRRRDRIADAVTLSAIARVASETWVPPPDGPGADVAFMSAFPPATALAMLARIARLERQLELCAEQFRFYAREHLRKGTPEGAQKAEVNRRWAEDCLETVGDRTFPVAAP